MKLFKMKDKMDKSGLLARAGSGAAVLMLIVALAGCSLSGSDVAATPTAVAVPTQTPIQTPAPIQTQSQTTAIPSDTTVISTVAPTNQPAYSPTVLNVETPAVLSTEQATSTLTPVATVTGQASTGVAATASPVTRTTQASPSPTDEPVTPGPTLPPTPTLIPLSQEQRVGLFEQVWRLVRDQYIYRDFRGLNWQSVHDEYLPRVKAAPDETAMYRVMADMIDKLGDQHSSFTNPEQTAEEDAQERGDLKLSGIGVQSEEIGNAVRIFYVVPGSPAEKAGLLPFDIIRAANGIPIKTNDDAPRLIRGQEGTAVIITVETPGKPPRDVRIVRRTINFAIHAQSRRWPGTNVVYLNLPSFDVDGITDEAKAEITELAKQGPLDGLVIDLRQNGGGLLLEMDNALGFFNDGGLAGYQVTLSERIPDNLPKGHTLAALRSKPIVVLVSKASESASERFAVAMHDLHRATILGTATAGNTETVYYHDLDYGARLALAQATFLRPDGTSIEDKGLMPDILMDVPWYEHSVDQDPQIIKAVDTIQHK